MKVVKNNWPLLVVSILVIAACIIRLKVYGDPRLAIATNDTQSYIESSRAPLFSWDAWTGRRLFTTNLMYKIHEPPGEYPKLRNGSINTSIRQIRSGFKSIAVTQWIISVLSWSLLTLVFSHHIKNPLLKLISALTILLFALMPQNADWDSVMGSESLSMSLLILQFAILILLAFQLSLQPELKPSIILMTGIWGITFILWAFTRDANLYVALVYLIMLPPLLKIAGFQKVRVLFIAKIFLVAAVFVTGLLSSAQSPRSAIQLQNVYGNNIHPNVVAVEFMQARGMPPPDSAGYSEWFKDNAATAYIQFLLAHPGYTASLLYNDTRLAFTNNLQPYFLTPRHDIRNRLIPIGDMLNIQSSSPLLLSAFLLAGLWMVASQNRIRRAYPWAWLATWLVLSAVVTLGVSVIGDIVAINRHAIISTAALRLFMWAFLIVTIDLALLPERGNLTGSNTDKTAGEIA